MQPAFSRFLEANRASKFQKFFDASPELGKIEGKYTLILAPDDETFDRLSAFAGNDRETIVNILKNHISIVKVNKVGHPTVTALSGLRFGSNINDLKRLEITAANNNAGPGLVVFVIKKFISAGVQQAEQTEEINYWLKLPQDLFVQLLTQNMEPNDIIRLCNSNSEINAKCNRNDQLMFRRMLPADYKPIPGQSPREAYIQLNNSRVWVSGENGEGQLGLGDFQRRTTLESLPEFRGVKQIICGNRHSLILDKEGRVWSTGYGANGELGFSLNGANRILTFKPIPEFKNIKEIIAGTDKSVMLDEFGRAHVFGVGHYGSLGLGDANNRMVPTMIPGFEGIRQFSIGYAHSAILDKLGRVWMFGSNHQGQLGLGEDLQQTLVPTMIPGFVDIKYISCGSFTTAFIDSENNVWTFGDNIEGQCGLGPDDGYIYVPTMIPNFTNIVKVKCSSLHTVFLDAGGNVFGCGSNKGGELGRPTMKFAMGVPVMIANGIRDIEVGPGTTGLIWLSGSITILGERLDEFHAAQQRSAPNRITTLELPNGLIPMQLSIGRNFVFILA